MELLDIFKSGKSGQNEIKAVGGEGGGSVACLAGLAHYCRNIQNKVIVVFSFVLIDAKEWLCINQFEKLVHCGNFKV